MARPPLELQHDAMHLGLVHLAAIVLGQCLLTRHDGGRAFSVHELKGDLVMVRLDENGVWHCHSCQNKGIAQCGHAAIALLYERALTGGR